MHGGASVIADFKGPGRSRAVYELTLAGRYISGQAAAAWVREHVDEPRRVRRQRTVVIG